MFSSCSSGIINNEDGAPIALFFITHQPRNVASGTRLVLALLQVTPEGSPSVLSAHQVLAHRADQFSPPIKPALCFAVHIHNFAVNQLFPPVDQQAHDHCDVALLCEMRHMGCCRQSVTLGLEFGKSRNRGFSRFVCPPHLRLKP